MSHAATEPLIPRPGRARGGTSRRPDLLIIACAVAFIALAFERLTADLWYDEILTLADYVLGQRSVWDVFRVYPVANNHVLFSAALWVWVSLTQRIDEWLLRLPNLLIALGSIGVIGWWWRRWLGNWPAIVGAMAMMFSEVFASFAFQLRGYGLSMLLGLLAVTAITELRSGRTTRGQIVGILSLLALPLVIPTNALLGIGVVLSGLVVIAGPLKRRVALLAPMTLALLVGSSYYLLIWEQFTKVVRQTEGWDSASHVIGHWTLALLMHLGALLIPVIPAAVRRLRGRRVPAPEGLRLGAMLLITISLPAMLFVMFSGSAPFPRTLLAWLGPWTIGVLLMGRDDPMWRKVPWALAAVVLLNAVIWQTVAIARTSRALAAGTYPQNLIMQYYDRDRSISTILARCAAEADLGRSIILTSFHDYPTAQYYGSVFGLDGGQIRGRAPGGRAAQPIPKHDVHLLLIIALNPRHAAQLLADNGLSGQPQLILNAGRRQLYRSGQAPVPAIRGNGNPP